MKEIKVIRCPKCSHEQKNTMECEACGLIFARYVRARDRQKEKEAEAAQQAKSSRTGMKIFGVVLLMLLTAGLTTYIMRPANLEKTDPRSVVPEPQTSQANIPDIKVKPAVIKKTENQSPQQGARSIEEARNATVSVETPWGTGSGFFVNKNYIITNRHVVEMDQQKLAELRAKIETGRKLIELEKQKLQELREKMGQLAEGPSRSQLALILETREAELSKVIPRQEEGEAKIAAMEKSLQPSDIKIFLADGRQFTANYLQVSSRHDLALMALHTIDSPYLTSPPGRRSLQQGDKVLTIGSPVGLRHTVTSGVFSGYRKNEQDGRMFLQTDAAINPGNSGGPLIDEKGHVLGVNTMILQDTEGIGFAIPIEVVYEEFSAARP